ncbi:MAG: YkoF family thiamine/hydroxymethylpyrimidine-binding protein [Verrucomicrobiota bacterium]
MIIQTELSLYPLRTAHIGNIIARFAEELRASGLNPKTGAMSTIVRGECRLVFAAIERAFATCGDKTDIVLVLKAGNACSDCVPNNKEK